MNQKGSQDDTRFAELLYNLAGLLSQRQWKLATAESCTGGWIAKCCTDLAGSSNWFDRGFITYSNEAKLQMLAVEENALRMHGAVSEVVARQMAEGARKIAGVEAALSVTGIAGPAGGSADKPVGTVWFGWALEGQQTQTEVMRFGGDRDAVRRRTVEHSLDRLMVLLDS